MTLYEGSVFSGFIERVNDETMIDNTSCYFSNNKSCMGNYSDPSILIIDLEQEYELRTLAVMSSANTNRGNDKF